MTQYNPIKSEQIKIKNTLCMQCEHQSCLMITDDVWSYVKKKYKLNMPFLVLSYPAKASALLSNAA